MPNAVRVQSESNTECTSGSELQQQLGVWMDWREIGDAWKRGWWVGWGGERERGREMESSSNPGCSWAELLIGSTWYEGIPGWPYLVPPGWGGDGSSQGGLTKTSFWDKDPGLIVSGCAILVTSWVWDYSGNYPRKVIAEYTSVKDPDKILSSFEMW